jgi:hypothetical protein
VQSAEREERDRRSGQRRVEVGVLILGADVRKVFLLTLLIASMIAVVCGEGK